MRSKLLDSYTLRVHIAQFTESKQEIVQQGATPAASLEDSAAASASAALLLFSASFLRAFSRARTVVDSTAWGTLAAAALVSCVTGDGYANRDGLHLHVAYSTESYPVIVRYGHPGLSSHVG